MTLIKLGVLDPRKLPAGHMVFQEGNGKNGLVVFDGKPYGRNGEPLPNDVAWLKENNYTVNNHVLRALAPTVPKQVTKTCKECGIELPLDARYCLQCATPQRVGTQDQDPEAFRSFLQGAPNPLDALDALQNPLVPDLHPNQVPDEPTLKDALADLGIAADAMIQGLPGDAPRSIKPHLDITEKQVVGFNRPQKSKKSE